MYVPPLPYITDPAFTTGLWPLSPSHIPISETTTPITIMAGPKARRASVAVRSNLKPTYGNRMTGANHWVTWNGPPWNAVIAAGVTANTDTARSSAVRRKPHRRAAWEIAKRRPTRMPIPKPSLGMFGPQVYGSAMAESPTTRATPGAIVAAATSPAIARGATSDKDEPMPTEVGAEADSPTAAARKTSVPPETMRRAMT